MKSSVLRKDTSRVEIENISPRGIWLFVKGHEYFLSHKNYPWFKNAKLSEIYNVKLLGGTHLHGPDLDVDMEMESLQIPEKYPLVYK